MYCGLVEPRRRTRPETDSKVHVEFYFTPTCARREFPLRPPVTSDGPHSQINDLPVQGCIASLHALSFSSKDFIIAI